MPFSEFVYLYIKYFVYCRRQKNISKTLRVVPIYKISEQIAPLICFGYHLLLFKFTLRWFAAHLWESACGANYGGAALPGNCHLGNGGDDNEDDNKDDIEDDFEDDIEDDIGNAVHGKVATMAMT